MPVRVSGTSVDFVSWWAIMMLFMWERFHKELYKETSFGWKMIWRVTTWFGSYFFIYDPSAVYHDYVSLIFSSNIYSLAGLTGLPIFFSHTRLCMVPALSDLLSVCTSWPYPQTDWAAGCSVSCFYCDELLSDFLQKETVREPKVKLNECVFSWRNEHERYEIHFWTVCFGLGS